jgi:glucose/arabinose dehydrogenase
MPKLRLALLPLAGALVLGTSAVGTASAQVPPPPTAPGGQSVTTVATGIQTPTAFALDPATKTLFISAFGNEKTAEGGGVYAIAPGATSATRVPGLGTPTFGVTFKDGTLYASTADPKTMTGQIVGASGWNGTAFGSMKTIFNAKSTVGAVNGLAFGPDGRLYGGGSLIVDVNKKGKAKKAPIPYPYSVFSVDRNGGSFKVISRGLRQPFQLTFPGSAKYPFVTDLSQDTGIIPKDAIVIAKPGQNYGFPSCFLGVGLACKGAHFTKTFVTLPKHASPQGIGSTADTLYVALFGGLTKNRPEVVTIPVAGGTPKPFLTGFVAPVVATNVLEGNVYTGDLTGTIYKVPVGG